MSAAPHDILDRLSPREREVCELLARGEGIKAIARKLGITRRTVKAHIANVKRKAGITGPLHRLVVWYLRAKPTALLPQE